MNREMNKHLVLATSTELLRIPVDQLVYIQADGNYSMVFTTDSKAFIVSFQIGEIENLIGAQLSSSHRSLTRIGKSLIVNVDYIVRIDVSKQLLVLSDCCGCYYELSASRDVLKILKNQLSNVLQ